MVSEAKQPVQPGQSTQADQPKQTDFSVDLREVKRLEGEWEKCRQGMARMDEYHDFVLQNAENLRRWRNSFSEPMEKMPGGAEFAEEQEAEIRKTLAQSDEIYEDAKAKYAAKQKGIEDQIDAAKKRIAASDDGQSFGARRSGAGGFAVGAGVTLTSGGAAYGTADATAYSDFSAGDSPDFDRGEAR